MLRLLRAANQRRRYLMANRSRAVSSSSSSRRGGSSSASTSRRSKLYERYNVNIKESDEEAAAHNNNNNNRRRDIREIIPIDEQTNIELIKTLFQNTSKSNLLLGLLVTMVLVSAIISRVVGVGESNDDNSSSTIMNSKLPNYNKNNYMAADSHARSNPFAEEGHISVMTGALETKRIGGNSQQNDNWKLCTTCDTPVGGGKVRQHDNGQIDQLAEEEPQLQQQQRTKRWNPCINHKKYELERHDHEARHGDVCRVKSGVMGLYECPEGCHDTAGSVPYCANTVGQKQQKNEQNAFTFGDKGGPCRVRNPDAPPEYRCDGGNVCIMAPATTNDHQFKGKGEYYDESCDNKCLDGMKGELSSWVTSGTGKCSSDVDCSLAGECMPNGKCMCDSWADGIDCSFLKFAPLDKSRIGYIDEKHSSWGGSIIQRVEGGTFVMYTSEILCNEQEQKGRKRCGLNNWETLSRIVRTESVNIDGPYKHVDVVLPPEHHNPSAHVSPATGDWHLYTISGPTGPIVRMISSDEGQTWSIPMTISPRQNPGPLLNEDGSTYLYYRSDGMDLPSPTCSDEGIAMQICKSDNEACAPPNDVPIFGHTGEDPSVFLDHRGNYHMLFNALPYKCVPKFQQGGHAWSTDGINWSTPRVGAFDTTIQFTDGTSMKCERRERPQMVLDKDGKPVALVTGMTGCPKGLGFDNEEVKSGSRFYRGADDSFTLIQMMNSS